MIPSLLWALMPASVVEAVEVPQIGRACNEEAIASRLLQCVEEYACAGFTDCLWLDHASVLSPLDHIGFRSLSWKYASEEISLQLKIEGGFRSSKLSPQ